MYNCKKNLKIVSLTRIYDSKFRVHTTNCLETGLYHCVLEKGCLIWFNNSCVGARNELHSQSIQPMHYYKVSLRSIQTQFSSFILNNSSLCFDIDLLTFIVVA